MRSLCKIAGAVLKRAGYEVIFGVNGVEGLAKLTQEGKRLSLIITDIAMPEMDGIEFATLSRQLYPELPIIMVMAVLMMPLPRSSTALALKIESTNHSPLPRSNRL